MDKFTNYSTSFQGVSINKSYARGRSSRSAQVINWGREAMGKLTKEKKVDTFESMTKKLSDLDKQMIQERENVDKKFWFRNYSINKFNQKEINLREQLNDQQGELLNKERARVSEIEKVVQHVETETNNIDKESAEYRKRIKASDAIERLKAEHESGLNGFSSIAGYDSEKNILNNYFITEIQKEEKGEKASVPGAVLFFGPTGNGKTAFAKAFANETGCKLVPMRLNINKQNKYELFETALVKKAYNAEENFKNTGKRTILFIDEFTKVGNEQSPIRKFLGKFLETCSEKYHCTVFAATNDPLNIKLPLTGNKSVFPYIISLDPPNKVNKTKILQHYLKDRLPENTNYDEIASHMENIEAKTGSKFNIAQIKEGMESGQEKDLSIEEVYKQIDSMTPAIDQASQEKYNNAVKVVMQNIVE